MTPYLRRITLLLAATGLAVACGGGGGGSSSVEVPAAATTSGLLPSAPAVGATLHADATKLRPLRDQALLTYRGIRFGNGIGVTHTNVVRQVVQPGGVREDESNSFGGGPISGAPVFVEDGAIKQRDSLLLAEGGRSEPVEVVELRSPVRVNDRYVMLDKRIADIGADLDNDKVNDAMDVAVWAEVIGEETLDLPNRTNVRAVRVDSRLRFRAQYSSDKTQSQVFESIVSIWYAPGIGIVRYRSDAPGANPAGPREVIEETLLTLDGIDFGLGQTEPLNPVAPAGSPLAGQQIGRAVQAIAIGDEAVVLSYIRNDLPIFGFTVTHLDNRGEIISTRNYRYADFLGLRGYSDLRMLRVGDEIKVFVGTDVGLQMISLSRNGQSMTAPPVVLVSEPIGSDASNATWHVEAAREGFWVAWLSYPEFLDERHVSRYGIRGFTAEGQPRGPVLLADPAIEPLAVREAQLRSLGDSVVLSWQQGGLPSRWRYVVSERSATGIIARVTLPESVSDSCPERLRGLPIGPNGALMCLGRDPAQVFRLDSSYAPVQMAGGSVALQPLLPLGWSSGDIFSIQDGLGAADVTQQLGGRLWPEEAGDSLLQTYATLPIDANPVNVGALRVLARVPAGRLQPTFLLPMRDRILVIGCDSGCRSDTLATAVVWR